MDPVATDGRRHRVTQGMREIGPAHAHVDKNRVTTSMTTPDLTCLLSVVNTSLLENQVVTFAVMI